LCLLIIALFFVGVTYPFREIVGIAIVFQMIYRVIGIGIGYSKYREVNCCSIGYGNFGDRIDAISRDDGNNF
jgi:hypothetical protein